ncbi:endonuclease/exonuclease/phosphatase family protein [Candidatus Uabimicrobium amorphum]|uniref:Endonuclease/exonuclease/phosphatase domain-containing protein n=1 Tax=Uabimicrobium amorphum TaxID=2596890 RepID=A0A5S9IRR5_UABAM|nr:endonuclease/exonuclease/phosphatase family protein [Candidatus Uabimicrobium amorphum]BBM85485.1 hypothetical protein UABAM_03854 [Candidatus Uabimicrobium amorphum]
MKAEIILWLLAITMGIYSYTSREVINKNYQFSKTHKQDLRIITWNVGGSTGKTGNALRYRSVPRVVNAMKNLQADIVVLQELDSIYQARNISHQLNGWRFIITKGSNRHSAIFYKGGYIIRSKSIAADPRHFLICDYHFKTNVMSIVALHASAYSAKKRNTVIGLSVDLLHSKPTKYKILAGDLNIDIDLDKRRDLFSDSEQLDVESYNYIAKSLKDTTIMKGSTAEPDRRLDYIFASGFTIKRGGPILNVKTTDMDHHPVVVDLDFK